MDKEKIIDCLKSISDNANSLQRMQTEATYALETIRVINDIHNSIIDITKMLDTGPSPIDIEDCVIDISVSEKELQEIKEKIIDTEIEVKPYDYYTDEDFHGCWVKIIGERRHLINFAEGHSRMMKKWIKRR